MSKPKRLYIYFSEYMVPNLHQERVLPEDDEYIHRDVVLRAMWKAAVVSARRSRESLNLILDRELEGKQTLPASGTSKG